MRRHFHMTFTCHNKVTDHHEPSRNLQQGKYSMSQNNKEATISIIPVYQRHVVIDENIHETLSLYALSLYMAFRYEADYRKEDSAIKRSAKFIYTKAKISRPQYYRCMNELESHGLIFRDSENKLGDKCVIHVARELGYFTKAVSGMHQGVSERDTGISQRDTDHYSFPLSNINITSSDVNESVKTKEVIEAYHEACPECPKIKVCGNELTKQIRSMIRNWPKYNNDNKEFTIDSFKDYLNYIKLHYPWFLQPYMTESGKEKRNNLTNITREKNIVRIVNGEFSAN